MKIEDITFDFTSNNTEVEVENIQGEVEVGWRGGERDA